MLASGRSQRFGAENKLLAEIDGVPLVRRTAQAYVEAQLRPMIVVVGHDGKRVQSALIDVPATIVVNPDYAFGQSRALVHAVAALSSEVDAAIVGVADQPYLTSAVIRSLVARFEATRASLVAPRFVGRRGNPVLFAASLFPELLAVTGDQGGRSVIAAHQADIEWVDIDDRRARIDIDTLDDLRELTAGSE